MHMIDLQVYGHIVVLYHAVDLAVMSTRCQVTLFPLQQKKSFKNMHEQFYYPHQVQIKPWPLCDSL